jgi:hypothetical protein
MKDVAPTLAEFLSPVRGGSHRDRVLGTLAYLERFSDERRATSTEIKAKMVSARLSGARKVNVADVLAKAGHLVDRDPLTAEWTLTTSGDEYVASKLPLEDVPSTQPVADSIRSVLTNISDEVAHDFVRESILCLEAGALRAAVVFMWSGAIRVLQERAMTHGSAAVSQAVRTHDPKARDVKKTEDFAQVKDRVALLAFRDLGLIDKGEWTTLQEGLDLRNRSGHPTKYRPGLAKVRAFIEDVVGIVFR